MGFVKRLTNLGRGLWKTRSAQVAERLDALDEELERTPVREPEGRQRRATGHAARPSAVEELALLETLRREGEVDEAELARRRQAVMARAVGDDAPEGDPVKARPPKTL